jgi:hypothetical protein
MALPTVSAKDLHTVQLDPKLRKILHHRAAAANRREYAPILAADRSAFGAANQAYQAEARSVKGATHMVEDALTQALQGLKGSGLSGGYLRQTQNELTARQGDAASSIPYLLADASQARTAAIGDARQQLVSDKAQMLSGTAADFNSLLASQREKGSSLVAAQEEDRKSESGEGRYDPKDLQNAKLALKDALTAWSKNPMVEGPDGEEVPLQQINPLKSKEDWLSFAAGLDHQYSGFGLAEINAVIQELLQNRQRKEHEGRLPQPGVPGPGRG